MAKTKAATVGAAFSTTIIFPKNDVITDLAEAKRNAKKRSQSINGTLGEKIGAAVEDQHLDRKAFGLACQLEAMDDERLHVTFHSLLHYLDVMGVTKRATAQEEMFSPGETAEPIAKIVDAKSTKGAAGKGKPKDGDNEANLAKIGKGRAVKEKAGEKEPTAEDVFKPLH